MRLEWAKEKKKTYSVRTNNRFWKRSIHKRSISCFSGKIKPIWKKKEYCLKLNLKSICLCVCLTILSIQMGNMYICVSEYLSIYISVNLYDRLRIYLCMYISGCPSFYVPLCSYIYLCMYLSLYLCLSLYTHIYIYIYIYIYIWGLIISFLLSISVAGNDTWQQLLNLHIQGMFINCQSVWQTMCISMYVCRVFTNGSGDRGSILNIQSQIKSYQRFF